MSDTINWNELSEVEKLKYDSNYLRGTLVESLANPITGAIAPGDTQISKFHGMYQQFDRDLEKERKRQKLEPAYSFLIRVRIPGGVVTPKQWLQMDDLSEQYAQSYVEIDYQASFPAAWCYQNESEENHSGNERCPDGYHCRLRGCKPQCDVPSKSGRVGIASRSL